MTRSLSLLLALTFVLSFAAGCGVASGIIEDIEDAIDNNGGGGGGGGGTDNATQMTDEERAFALSVFDLVNEYRADNGVAPLTWDEQAAGAAFLHSVYQRNQGDGGHVGEGGTDPGERLTAAGILWSDWSENVAVGQSSPESVMQAWITSPEHNDNLLATDVTRLGVGCRFGAGGIYAGPWWTQKFFDP